MRCVFKCLHFLEFCSGCISSLFLFGSHTAEVPVIFTEMMAMPTVPKCPFLVLLNRNTIYTVHGNPNAPVTSGHVSKTLMKIPLRS